MRKSLISGDEYPQGKKKGKKSDAFSRERRAVEQNNMASITVNFIGANGTERRWINCLLFYAQIKVIVSLKTIRCI